LIVENRKISKKSLFGILSIGIGVGSLLLFIFIASLAFLDLGSMTLNAELELGPIDFFFVLLVWPFVAMLWILLTWPILILGLWVSGKIGVMKIHFQDEKVTWPKHRGKGT
jgi:hypothetical protein